MVFGGPSEFMKTKLRTAGIFNELRRAAMMLFIALKLLSHSEANTDIAKTAFISDFKLLENFLSPS
jgi:hypothetical protein